MQISWVLKTSKSDFKRDKVFQGKFTREELTNMKFDADTALNVGLYSSSPKLAYFELHLAIKTMFQVGGKEFYDFLFSDPKMFPKISLYM